MSSDPSSQTTNTVTLSQARLVYDGVVLFDGLELALPQGQITCLLGPSGVGKTTLLRLIAGLATPEPPTKIATHDDASYMAQQDLLLPWLNVMENTVLGYRLRGKVRGALDLDEMRQHAATLLSQFGLGSALHQLPATLSGGMRQRVALARTLLEDRKLILMDEPFSQLDAITRLELQDLAGSRLKGRTVLLITHDPLEALRLGDRILIMAGRPATLGAPIDVANSLAGDTPRDPSDPALLALQAELIKRLRAAHAATRDTATRDTARGMT
ncbi:MAG: ABC transporter ATP-binding protein [Rhodospirillales bacterium]